MKNILLFLFSIQFINSQQITGIVQTDETSLNGVLLYYKKSSFSALTNEEGKFSIEKSSIENDTLIVTKLGFNSAKISSKKIQNYEKINLRTPEIILDEVVINPLKAQEILDKVLANFDENHKLFNYYEGNFIEKFYNNNNIDKFLYSKIGFDIINNKKNKMYLLNKKDAFQNYSSDYSKPALYVGFRNIIQTLDFSSFLEKVKQNIKNYTCIKKKSIFNDKEVYILEFKDKNKESRELIINSQDFSVLSYNIIFSVDMKKKQKESNSILNIKELKINVNFRKNNQKYILSNFTSRILGEYEKNNKTYPLSDEIRFIVTNICIENCSKSNEILIIKPISKQITNTKIFIDENLFNKQEIEFLKSQK